MKKKLTLTIDEDVYKGIGKLPKEVSISEMVSWLLKAMIEDVKKGREMTQEEFDAWIEGTPDGRDFRERFIEKYGPHLNRLKLALDFSAIGKQMKKKRA